MKIGVQFDWCMGAGRLSPKTGFSPGLQCRVAMSLPGGLGGDHACPAGDAGGEMGPSPAGAAGLGQQTP